MVRVYNCLIIACVILLLMSCTGVGKVFHPTVACVNESPLQSGVVLTATLLSDTGVTMADKQDSLGERFSFLNQVHEDYSKQYSAQRVLLIAFVVVLVIVCVFLALSLRAYYIKHLLNVKLTLQKHRLLRQRDEMALQIEMAEQDRHRLEEEKDRLIEEKLLREEQLEPGDKFVLPELSHKTEEEYEEAIVRFQKKLTKVIESRMDDSELTVDMIGAEMNLSRVQLYRKCKAASGISPIELLRTIRLQKSHALLHETDMTVSEVAYTVGFSSPSYFAKCYKDQYGVNPSNDGASFSFACGRQVKGKKS
ncbi:MAG: helix-turn-helix domain-containing protein [Bacteroidales bacterium]|nr:helix-turn-helix domain-containing protein [Bacteroidales bacterium]